MLDRLDVFIVKTAYDPLIFPSDCEARQIDSYITWLPDGYSRMSAEGVFSESAVDFGGDIDLAIRKLLAIPEGKAIITDRAGFSTVEDVLNEMGVPFQQYAPVNPALVTTIWNS